MKKIISLFRRNEDRRVMNRVVPGAEWVVAGEGVATRKYDGTSCLIRQGKLYKRYDAKGGKTPPPGFEPAQDPDPVTGHWPGWLLVGDGPEDKYHREALVHRGPLRDWTYELLGPKVQGNHEKLLAHALFRHGGEVLENCPRDFEALKLFLQDAAIEGVVWWRDITDLNCDKVKIKAKDFGIKR